jgi:hypothetical protein
MEKLITKEYDIIRMSLESIEYIRRHHNHIKIAEKYVEFWKQDK